MDSKQYNVLYQISVGLLNSLTLNIDFGSLSKVLNTKSSTELVAVGARLNNAVPFSMLLFSSEQKKNVN